MPFSQQRIVRSSSIFGTLLITIVCFALAPCSLVIASSPHAIEIPVVFEENRGQAPDDTAFLSRTPNALVFFREREFEWILPRSKPTGLRAEDPAGHTASQSVRFKLVGATNDGPPLGSDPLRAGTNYFYGNSPDDWLIDVPQYAALQYHNVYHGIDMTVHSRRGSLEYDFIVQPGADPARIEVAVEGNVQIHKTSTGDIAIAYNGKRKIVQKRPFAYQRRGQSLVAVTAAFEMRSQTQYGFAIGEYDPSLPLVIDPIIYATPLPGAFGFVPRYLGVNAAGHAYMTGTTSSPNLPTASNAVAHRCGPDVRCEDRGSSFLLVLDPTASGADRMLYGSYFPMLNMFDFAVDGQGAAYLLGITEDANYPTTPNAFDNRCEGEAFVTSLPDMCEDFNTAVTKVDPSIPGAGSLVYATYFPAGERITFDGLGNIYVGGRTTSPTFPVTKGAFDTICGMNGLCDRGQGDAFISKFDPTAPAERSLAYSTLIGEVGREREINLHITDSGNIVFLLATSYDGPSNIYTAIPTTPNAIATNRRGGGLLDGNSDIYIGIIEPAGNGLDDLKFGTFLGGKGFQNVRERSMAVGENGYITIAIESRLGGLPVTPNIVPNPSTRTINVYVLHLDPFRANPVLYGTYLGGNAHDSVAGVATDSHGFIYVFINTASSDLPTKGSFYFGCGGGSPCAGANWFLAKLDPRSQNSLAYSTYGGGSGTDGVSSFFLGSNQNVYVNATTTSETLPVTEGRSDRRNGDAYIMEIQTTATGPDSIAYATLVGGQRDDSVIAMQPDGQGNLHLIGQTGSDDLGFSEDTLGDLHQTSGFYMLLSVPD